MASEMFCEICRENLRTKKGSFVATVSLFCENSNKEFSSALSGKPVILAKLLADLGIVVVQHRQRSVCKKCARKIVNCYKLFTELRKPFVVGLAREKSEEISNSSPQLPERDRCRVLAHVQHVEPPTGIPNWNDSDG